MKLLPWVLSLALFAASSVFAQDVVTSGGTITTSKSTLRLPPFEGLTTENSFRQAGSIAEIGFGELKVDAAALDQEEKTLLKEIATYEQKKKEEQALLNDMEARFNVFNKKYLEGRDKYEESNSTLEAETLQQRAEALASNSLPPTQRDPATVSRLTQWAIALGARRAILDKERKNLVEERKVVETQRIATVNFKQGADARLKAAHDSLQARIDTLKAKMGLAYRQLKRCADYAVRIEAMIKAKFNKAEVRSPALDGAMEQLRALSGRGWDTF